MNKSRFFALLAVLTILMTTVFVQFAQDEGDGITPLISLNTRMSADSVAPHWVYSGPLPTSTIAPSVSTSMSTVEVSPRWAYVGPHPES